METSARRIGGMEFIAGLAVGATHEDVVALCDEYRAQKVVSFHVRGKVIVNADPEAAVLGRNRSDCDEDDCQQSCGVSGQGCGPDAHGTSPSLASSLYRLYKAMLPQSPIDSRT